MTDGHDDGAPKKKLTLSKKTLKTLSVRSGVRAGDSVKDLLSETSLPQGTEDSCQGSSEATRSCRA